MNTGTIEITAAPTGSVSHSVPPSHHGRRPRRRALFAVASGVLAVGSISFATHAAANDEFENRCVPTASGSPDSLERQVMACQTVLDEAYVECMRNAAGTPDSAERWVEYCQTRAVG